MNDSHIPSIALSIGDYNGIGPEILLKTLSQVDLSDSTPILAAPADLIQMLMDQLSLDPGQSFHTCKDEHDIRPNTPNILPLDGPALRYTPGVQSAESGKTAMLSIQKCIDLCMNGMAQAMVTAPISKEAVNLAGYKIPGHTEYLARQTQTEEVLMMLVSGDLRVALVTAHLPIRQVSSAITEELIRSKVKLLANSLRKDFGLTMPRIAVFGLNPHAGDGGVIGMEEIDLINPLIEKIRTEHDSFSLHGPFPADGFFGQKLHLKHDAILAMYHDQGLAPFKLLSFGKGVNFTAGLPIIRTSPDHGTAFDIAGKGIANPSSFLEAYNLAVKLAKRRSSEDTAN